MAPIIQAPQDDGIPFLPVRNADWPTESKRTPAAGVNRGAANGQRGLYDRL